MAFQPVPDVIEYTVHFTNGAGIPVVNTFYGERPGGYVQGDLDIMVENIANIIEDNWLPVLTALVTYVRVDARGLALQNDLFASSSLGAGIGQVVGDALAPHSTLAIKRLSNKTGRSARGRIFWPAIAISQASGTRNEAVTPSIADNFVAAVDAVRMIMIAGGQDPVIVSRWENNVKRPTGVTFEWISTSVTDLFIDSQRRRKAV